MAKIWNPGALPETVNAFVQAWCLVEPSRNSRVDDLFGAYETYCRTMRCKDLTQGEFDAEMERLGYIQGRRHGATVWQGVGLALLEDGLVGRRYGARFRSDS